MNEEEDNNDDNNDDNDDDEKEKDNEDGVDYDDDRCLLCWYTVQNIIHLFLSFSPFYPILSMTILPLPSELVDSVEYVNQLPAPSLNLDKGL